MIRFGGGEIYGGELREDGIRWSRGGEICLILPHFCKFFQGGRGSRQRCDYVSIEKSEVRSDE